MSAFIRLFTLAFVWFSLPATAPVLHAAESEPVVLDHSSATLITSRDSLSPTKEFLVGVRIKLEPHWHTYTYDPGDSGIPTTITWTLPEGFKASSIYWPPYETFNEAGLTTYGFSNEVVLTTLLTSPGDLFLADSSTIGAKVEYLVCKDICVPQTAELSLILPKGDAAESASAPLLNEWKNKSEVAPGTPIKAKDDTTSSSNASQDSSVDTPSEQNQTSHTTLLSAVFFALLGGLILNLMPCVFPVLSLKALAIAKHSEMSRATIRKEGVAYTLGVLSCFWVLALLLIALQQAGESIGWGFQFQSPAFVALMALLMLFIGLNLSGVYELPVLFGNVATQLEKPDSLKGSYFTGLLAALVATPCTAPFMATAVGAALSQTPVFAITVFTALGLGLSLPFLLLSYVPSLLKWLPKPGAWMLTFKSLLAFPMYLSAVWLLWVVGTQTGIIGMTAVLTTAVIVLFMLWAKRPCKFESRFCMAANIVVVIAMLVVMSQGLTRLQSKHSSNAQMQAASYGEPYSKARLDELRRAGVPVFVDATASWCITCQINKKVAIETTAVQNAFKERGVVTLIADWTNKDAAITEFLSSYGYKGVPLYVYYPPQGDGVVLPQLLTPAILINTINPTNQP